MATTLHPAYAGPERRLSNQAFRGTDRRSVAAPAIGGMESHAKFLGHPVHQQLVAFPVGLLATSVLFDLIHLAGGGATLAVAAFWMLVAGLAGAALAAPFGFIDWRAIPKETRAKRVGAVHGIGNVGVVLLFGLSALLRINDAATPPGLAVALSILGGLLALVTAWLGGELVSRLGVGISAQAGLDAPNSMRER